MLLPLAQAMTSSCRQTMNCCFGLRGLPQGPSPPGPKAPGSGPITTLVSGQTTEFKEPVFPQMWSRHRQSREGHDVKQTSWRPEFLSRAFSR